MKKLKYAPKIKTKASLEKEIDSIKPNSVVLFVVSGKNYHTINLEILRTTIQKKKFSGIYITVNRPFKSLKKYLEENKIDTERIFFIDMITKTAKEKMEITRNCLYIPSPTNLTDLGIAISEALSAMKDASKKFLFLDSLSTLLIYNSKEVVAKFVHYLVTKVKILGLIGLMISIEKQIDEKLMYLLLEMCDKAVEVDI